MNAASIWNYFTAPKFLLRTLEIAIAIALLSVTTWWCAVAVGVILHFAIGFLIAGILTLKDETYPPILYYAH